MKVCIFWKCIDYIIHWDKTQILKKSPSDKKTKKNGTNNALFFFFCERQLIIVVLLICDSYELKHKVCLSKTVCGIFHFRFRFVLIKVYIFVQPKSLDSLTLKRHNSFQNENNRKTTHCFSPRPLIFKLQQEVLRI